MHYVCNFFVRSVVVCGLLVPLCVQSFTLKPPSYEQCAEKSQKVRSKLERERYLRAVLLAASAAYTTYALWNWFTTEKPAAAETKIPKVAPQELSGFYDWAKWAGSSFVSFSKMCAQHICVSWVSSRMFHSNAHPPVYIAKYVHYKIHGAEIERLLTNASESEMSKDEICRCDLLLQGHLQALVDKVEGLMAYMLYYGAAQLPSDTQAFVEAYVAETMRTLAHTVHTFNNDYTTDAQGAITACKKACIEMLISSIKYAQATFPRDE